MGIGSLTYLSLIYHSLEIKGGLWEDGEKEIETVSSSDSRLS